MTRDDFFKGEFSQSYYDTISARFSQFEDAVNDIKSEVCEQITSIMDKLYNEKSSTEFVGKYHTLINRFGDIGVIKNGDDEEVSIDDIDDVNEIIDILSEFI